jgi:hypothetical protein
MSEETQDHNDGTWSGLKKTIIGLVTTVVLGAGGVVTNKLIGEGEEAAPVQQAAPVININNTQSQQQAAGGGKTVIIKEKSSAPAPQAAPAPKPKNKEGDEFKEEAPKW